MSLAIDYMKARIWKMAHDAADEWFKRALEAPYTPFYLYYLEAEDTAWGFIRCAPEEPGKYWKLASPERISPMYPADYHAKQFVKIMQNLPIVGYCPGDINRKEA